MYDRPMPSRLVSVALSLSLAGAVAAALAASAAPIAMQERPLVLPKRPAGADQPTNLPEDGAVKLPFVHQPGPLRPQDLRRHAGRHVGRQGWPQEPARDPAMRTQR
jgi:hypothetical protein